MNDYKPNSHRSKEAQSESLAERKVEKVVSGQVKTKKKNDIHKLKDVFLPGDAKTVKSYVLMDVLIPAFKKMISDSVDIFLNGENRRDSRRSNTPKVSYRNYYDRRDEPYAADSRSKSAFDYDDLIFDNRGDAEAVLTQLDEMIERYKMVSVFDLYDSAGITAPYTANKYGWTDLRNAEVIRVREGYVIKLPKALPID